MRKLNVAFTEEGVLADAGDIDGYKLLEDLHFCEYGDDGGQLFGHDETRADAEKVSIDEVVFEEEDAAGNHILYDTGIAEILEERYRSAGE